MLKPWPSFTLVVLCAVSAHAFQVQGVVTDARGEAVVGAKVWLEQDRTIRQTETAEKGYFVFEDATAGAVNVVVWKEGHAVGGLSAPLWEDMAMAIALGEPATLTLRVVDQRRKPIEGARIGWMQVAESFSIPAADLARHGFMSWRSGEDGVITIPGLPAGAYANFTIEHLQYAGTYVPYMPVGVDETKGEAPAYTVENGVASIPVAEGGTASISVRPGTAGDISATGAAGPELLDISLYDGCPLHGRVTGADGAAVKDARVTVFRVSGQFQGEIIEPMTDPDGFYTVNLRPGKYYVAARHPDFAPGPPLQVLVTRESDNVMDVTLERPVTVSGRVLAGNGSPADGVIVTWSNENKAHAETRTLADGMYSLAVGPGDGYVAVVPPPGAIAEGESGTAINAAPNTPLELEPFVLREAPEVHGVVQSSDGRPLGAVLISSVDLMPPVWLLTDEQGRFSIRLAYLPTDGTAAFRAEHRDTLERALFTADFDTTEAMAVTLAPFKPDISAGDTEGAPNDLSALVGKRAPNIVCPEWFNSDFLTLESLKGKVVVLTFWDSYDASAEQTDRVEELRALYDLFRPTNDVTFILIHRGGRLPALVERRIKEKGILMPVACDDGTDTMLLRYAITQLPQTVLLDKTGTVRHFRVQGRLLELIKSLRMEGGGT